MELNITFINVDCLPTSGQYSIFVPSEKIKELCFFMFSGGTEMVLKWTNIWEANVNYTVYSLCANYYIFAIVHEIIIKIVSCILAR